MGHVMYVSIKDDLVLAGAEWTDEAVVVSGRLVTSRTPADLAVSAENSSSPFHRKSSPDSVRILFGPVFLAGLF